MIFFGARRSEFHSGGGGQRGFCWWLKLSSQGPKHTVPSSKKNTNKQTENFFFQFHRFKKLFHYAPKMYLKWLIKSHKIEEDKLEKWSKSKIKKEYGVEIGL